MKRIIQRLHSAGKTVMFNSHVPRDVHELCSRIAIMCGDGWCGRDCRRKRLSEAATLEDFFMKVVTA